MADATADLRKSIAGLPSGGYSHSARGNAMVVDAEARKLADQGRTEMKRRSCVRRGRSRWACPLTRVKGVLLYGM
jgi:hypothetical protein